MERFKVDLRGIVDLLSTAIYTTPSVYLRELIQNAADAVTARRQLDPRWHTAGIVITPAGVSGRELRITDDGIGLTASDITEFLATVGGSLKRDSLGLPASGMLGRFGIGLLSALMVADEIVVRTQSATGGPSLQWTGRGDGTFDLQELTETLPVGTEVVLSTRADDTRLVGPEAVRRLASHYARYLPVPISVATKTGLDSISEEPAFLSDDPATLIDFGTELLGAQPFDVIQIDVPLTGTRGVAYVLPHPVPPQGGGAHTVYCSRMLVSERCREIAPEWAFFARIVLDSTGLNPTASREGLIDDPPLGATRDAIGAALRSWIVSLARQDPLRLEAFVATHYLGLKALAVHDDEIGPSIIRLLPMETSRGLRTIAEIVDASAELAYVPTTDQFRQVNALTRQLVINATYTWDAEVLRRLPELIPGVRVREVTVTEVLQGLEPVGTADRQVATRLQARAVWEQLVFLLNGVIFIAIGLQLGALHDTLPPGQFGPVLWWAVAVSLTAIVVRLLWVPVATVVPRWLSPALRARDPVPRPAAMFLIGWVGMRGIVSLASALALPETTAAGAALLRPGDRQVWLPVDTPGAVAINHNPGWRSRLKPFFGSRPAQGRNGAGWGESPGPSEGNYARGVAFFTRPSRRGASEAE